MSYLLGIDTGSTVVKAALFDAEGGEIATASRKSPVTQPQPGHSEFAMEESWRLTAEAVAEAVASSGVAAADIKCVAPTGFGNGLLLLDRGGKPLGAGITSLDSRASGVVEAWSAQVEGFHAITTQNIFAAQPPAILAWIRDNEPERFDAIGSILLRKDFTRFRLSGVLGSELTDLAGAGLVDTRTGEYSEQLLEAYGLTALRGAPQPPQPALCLLLLTLAALHAGALPPIHASASVVGHVTAEAAAATTLAPGTPVAAGLWDLDASALGAGVTRPGQACLVAGTWSINQALSEGERVSREILMSKPYVVEGLWMAIEASATSATNLEWFVDQVRQTEPHPLACVTSGAA